MLLISLLLNTSNSILSTILHIGYPKTASTWFQEVFYPKLSNVRYIHRHVVQNQLLKPGAFEWDLNTCKANLITNTDRLAICEELLLGRLRAGGVKHFLTKEVANRLHKVFPDGKVVFFLRNQPNALASSYYQYIKAGGNYSISKFLFPEKISAGDYNPLVLLSYDYFNYIPVLEYYESLFGKENIHIYLYEDFIASPKEFLAKYCADLNLKIDLNEINFTPINDGYRKLLIPFRKFTNAFTRKGPLHKYYLINLPFIPLLNDFFFYRANKYLRFLPKAPAHKILGKRNYKTVVDYYRKPNALLLSKYGLNGIKKHSYPL